MLRRLLVKISNLCEVLQLPHGLKLKLTEPAFCRLDLVVCTRLRASGVFPGSIVDVGANIGQFALAATTIWPGVPIISFEPIPEAFAGLQETARRHPAITPVCAALGASRGRATFHLASHSQSSSLLPLGAPHRSAYTHIRETGTLELEVSTLADELPRYPGPEPRLLKLDVQGYESQVLAGAGAGLRAFRWILLETSSRPMYEGEVPFRRIYQQLEEAGFELLTPTQLHITPGGAIGQFDALFEQTTPA